MAFLLADWMKLGSYPSQLLRRKGELWKNLFSEYHFIRSCRQLAGSGEFAFGFLMGRVVTESGQTAGVSHSGVGTKEHLFFCALVYQIQIYIYISYNASAHTRLHYLWTDYLKCCPSLALILLFCFSRHTHDLNFLST